MDEDEKEEFDEDILRVRIEDEMGKLNSKRL